jgi:hypothetical protein
MKKVALISIAMLFAVFVFAQTQTELKVKDLPKSIPAYVAKNMDGFSISRAFKVIINGVQSYQVVVKKGDIKHILGFDKDGNFNKKSDRDLKAAKENLKQVPPPAEKPKAEDKKK